ALFPSVLSEAARSERPISTFLIAIQNNILLNIRLLTEADPRTSIEDQALLFFAILALAGALVMPRLAANERTIARAIYYSSGLIVMAMFAAYVVRAKGGVWGGVRALMPWSVLWLILTAVGLVKLVQRKWALVIVVAVLVFGFVVMDRLQVYHFYRLKYADREDQARCESYMERYLGRGQPRRILARNFLFGLHNYPVETIWSLPRDYEEMRALEQAIGFDYVILQERSPIRLHFVQNPRYIRINKEDKGAEFLIWRRLY
ncbi:MAG: hypothetical protein MUF51_08300, partial [Vicinamibacteria bacterium]|nr:hypothetical protein [Vicinamibacteria bacterium]